MSTKREREGEEEESNKKLKAEEQQQQLTPFVSTDTTMVEWVKNSNNIPEIVEGIEMHKKVYHRTGSRNLFVGSLGNKIQFKMKWQKNNNDDKKAVGTQPSFFGLKFSFKLEQYFNHQLLPTNRVHLGLPIMKIAFINGLPYGSMNGSCPPDDGKESQAEIQIKLEPTPYLCYPDGIPQYDPLGLHYGYFWLKYILEEPLQKLIKADSKLGRKDDVLTEWKTALEYENQIGFFVSRKIFNTKLSPQELKLLHDDNQLKENAMTQYIAQNICRDPKKPCLVRTEPWCFKLNKDESIPMNSYEQMALKSGDLVLPAAVSVDVKFLGRGGTLHGPKFEIQRLVWLGPENQVVKGRSKLTDDEFFDSAVTPIPPFTKEEVWLQLKKKEEKTKIETETKSALAEWGKVASRLDPIQ